MFSGFSLDASCVLEALAQPAVPGSRSRALLREEKRRKGLPGVAARWKELMCLDVSVLWSRVWGLAGLSPSSALLPGGSRVSVFEPGWTELSRGGRGVNGAAGLARAQPPLLLQSNTLLC